MSQEVVTPDFMHAVISLLSGLAGGAGAGFWFRRWIDKTDKTLGGITSSLSEIKIEVAVIRERQKVLEQRLPRQGSSAVIN